MLGTWCVVVKGTLFHTTSARPAVVLTQLFLEGVPGTLFCRYTSQSMKLTSSNFSDFVCGHEDDLTGKAETYCLNLLGNVVRNFCGLHKWDFHCIVMHPTIPTQYQDGVLPPLLYILSWQCMHALGLVPLPIKTTGSSSNVCDFYLYLLRQLTQAVTYVICTFTYWGSWLKQ